MPLYEFKCKDCSRVFEELVSLNSDKSLPCPDCRSTNTAKIMSAAAVGRSQGSLPSCGGGCPGAASCNAAHACSQFS